MATATKTEKAARSTAFGYLSEVLIELLRGKYKINASRFEVHLQAGTRLGYMEGEIVFWGSDESKYGASALATVRINSLMGGAADTITIEPHPDAPWSRVKLLDEVLKSVFPQAD